MLAKLKAPSFHRFNHAVRECNEILGGVSATSTVIHVKTLLNPIIDGWQEIRLDLFCVASENISGDNGGSCRSKYMGEKCHHSCEFHILVSKPGKSESIHIPLVDANLMKERLDVVHEDVFPLLRVQQNLGERIDDVGAAEVKFVEAIAADRRSSIMAYSGLASLLDDMDRKMPSRF